MKFLLRLLNDFKFARRKLGGVWYFVEVKKSEGGMQGAIQYWTQEAPREDLKVIKTEVY
jgi:hypothetical protein